MGKKKVTFSSLVKVVSDDGEIRYERDWGVTPFDFLGQTENIDFIQQQFEKKLSILGHAGKEDLERLQELSIPFFQCTTTVVEKMGALEYLRLLAETPICGPMPTSNQRSPAIMTTLPKKKPDRRLKNAKKNGIYRPKEIPGRDSPEQRKQILMNRRPQPRIFEKYYASLMQRPIKKPTSILKMATNDIDTKPIIDLTYIDHNSLFGADDDEGDVDDHWSWDDETSDERRDDPDEEGFCRSMYDTSTRWVPRKVPRISHDSSSRQDPPGFRTIDESSLSTDGKDATTDGSCSKPNPRHQSSPPSLRYGHTLPGGTSKHDVPAE